MTRLDTPLLLLAGVPKCGTTSLFAALREHPGVSVPVRKEPQFFALSPRLVEANLGWYRSLFASEPTQQLLDGSTLTCFSPEAPGLLLRHAPDAKVVLVVRDPAKRVFSAYLHMLKQVPYAEQRSFEEVLSGMESAPPGADLADWEDEQIRAAGRAGTLRLDYFRPDHHRGRFGATFETEFEDPLAVYRYFTGSQYGELIDRWRAALGDRLHVVVFERLVRDPEGVIAEVLSFAGLPAANLYLAHENEGRLPKNGAVRVVLGFFRRSLVGRRLGDWMRAAGLVNLTGRLSGLLWDAKPVLSEDHYARTRALLADEYDRWFEDAPELRSLWSRPGSRHVPPLPSPVGL